MTIRDPIFLFSMPRSGSTLLQRIIAAHSQVVTAAEPWLLLPFFQGLRPHAGIADHGHALASLGIKELLEEVPAGERIFGQQVAALAQRLYSEIYPEIQARYFLDKTPRYSLIVDDILEHFPDARMIVLWRNPLAMVSSMVETWDGGRWKPWKYNADLFSGIDRLTAAVERAPERFHCLKYEDLVGEPEACIRAVMRHLDLPYEFGLLDDFAGVTWQGSMGDPTGRHAYKQVDRGSLEKWRCVLGGTVRKRWMRRYLAWLGRERLTTMGYDYDTLSNEISALPSMFGRLPSDAGWTAVGQVRLFVQHIARSSRHRGELTFAQQPLLN